MQFTLPFSLQIAGYEQNVRVPETLRHTHLCSGQPTEESPCARSKSFLSGEPETDTKSTEFREIPVTQAGLLSFKEHKES